MSDRRLKFNFVSASLLIYRLYEVKKQHELALLYLRDSVNITKDIFGKNIHNAVEFFYNRYLPWGKPSDADYDIKYLNEAMRLNKELYGEKNNVEQYRYQYLKALYYIKNNQYPLAKKMLMDIALQA